MMTVTCGTDASLAGGRLTVDLAALAQNYRMLARASAPAKAAAVVKADAYGLGVKHVVPVLLAAGCETFFVALPHEGLAVREMAPDADMFVFNGLSDAEAAKTYVANRLIPLLNSAPDIDLWSAFSNKNPCGINVDTGMNRLGLPVDEALALARDQPRLASLSPIVVMSHLACADEPDYPKNRHQLKLFQRVAVAFAGVGSSFANSAGIFLGPDYRFGLTRPGIALYGGQPVNGVRHALENVVTLELRVAQIRHARAGETVSYGATAKLERDSVIAVASAGYADGIFRAASGSGVPLRTVAPDGGHGFVAGRRVPILGRVTMDLTMFDVTDVGPEAAKVGDFIEIIGPNMPLEEAAKAAGTISYELLTNLGKRFERRYVGGAN